MPRPRPIPFPPRELKLCIPASGLTPCCNCLMTAISLSSLPTTMQKYGASGSMTAGWVGRGPVVSHMVQEKSPPMRSIGGSRTAFCRFQMAYKTSTCTPDLASACTSPLLWSVFSHAFTASIIELRIFWTVGACWVGMKAPGAISVFLLAQFAAHGSASRGTACQKLESEVNKRVNKCGNNTHYGVPTSECVNSRVSMKASPSFHV